MICSQPPESMGYASTDSINTGSCYHPWLVEFVEVEPMDTEGWLRDLSIPRFLVSVGGPGINPSTDTEG